MAKGGFNLAALDTIAACNKPFEVNIKDVRGVPTSVYISVLGKDSDAFRGVVRALADESLRKQGLGKSSDNLDAIEAKNINALAAATTGWRDGDEPVLLLGEERLEFSQANARKVYAAILPIREQVTEAINNLENFMPA